MPPSKLPVIDFASIFVARRAAIRVQGDSCAARQLLLTKLSLTLDWAYVLILSSLNMHVASTYSQALWQY